MRKKKKLRAIPAPTPAQLRKELIKDAKWCFDLAHDMCGSHHPDNIATDMAFVRETQRAVFRILRSAKV